MFALQSCKNDKYKQWSTRELKIYETAKMYFVEHKDKGKFNVIAQLKENNDSETFYFSIYPYGFVTENHLPYRVEEYEGNYIFYYGGDQNFTEEEKDRIIEELKSKGLLFDFDAMDTYDNNLKLEDGITWHCFVCKKDMEKIEIIKSPYILDKEEMIHGVCD
ncbi:hypothetical protein SAMN04488009_0174 [Maribacter sedimenticola]|uniref:Uncharacterized protein n=2 Tax=Maribacter sedimenticola TaxID=228956 RepID=A0ABY1SM93_9FLAO|nr:hypothetical protein SAMN04488009_0174 [Maribacter sedimenticola]